MTYDIQPFTSRSHPHTAVFVTKYDTRLVDLDRCVRTYGDTQELGIRNSHELIGALSEETLRSVSQPSLKEMLAGDNKLRFRTVHTNDILHVSVIPAQLMVANATLFPKNRASWLEQTVTGEESPTLAIATMEQYIIIPRHGLHVSFGGGETTHQPTIEELRELIKHNGESPLIYTDALTVRIHDIVDASYVPMVFGPGHAKFYTVPFSTPKV